MTRITNYFSHVYFANHNLHLIKNAYFCNNVAFSLLLQSMNTADNLLQAHNLHKTPCRADVVNTLASCEVALSEKELKEKLNFDYDRSTLFRTLRKFLQTGIIHSIAINGQDIRYAINHNNQHQGTHHHAHFHCGQCNSVVCLEHVSIQQPQIPAGFEAEEFNLVINGKCPSCNQPTDQ